MNPSFSKSVSAERLPLPEGKFEASVQTTDRATSNLQPEEKCAPFRNEETQTLGPPNSSRPHFNPDPFHLSPYKQSGLRAVQTDLTRSASEPDSLLDLYGRPRSHVESMDNGDQIDTKEPFYLEDEDPEHSRWIHRDKLALIESHEMQEAGIKLPLRSGRATSKSNGTRAPLRDPSREQSRDRYRNGLPEHELDIEGTKFQMPLKKDDKGEISPGDILGPEVQKSEETSSEPLISTISSSITYRQQGTRSSSSRIPVPKSSPLPLPQGSLDRHAPSQRKGGASGNWGGGEEEGVFYDKTRSRSQSVGSQVLLDDGDLVESPSTSPTKRQAGKLGPSPSSSNARKATNALRNASDPQKSRLTPSTTCKPPPSQGPKSRSGLEPRPATAVNRPEGDPPWLATMYKPDPRLPPEQQLLPTHAKRMQQERETGFGSGSGSGSTFDSDFGPLAVHTHEGLQLSPHSFLPIEKDGIGKPATPEPGWPLKSLTNKENGSPSAAGTDHGGYSTIPKVQNSPKLAAGTVSTPRVTKQQQQQQQQQPKKASGGCPCCVVM